MASLLKKVLIAACAVLFVNTADAQTAVRDSDYVISTQGDTIHCRVNTPFIGRVNYTPTGAAGQVKMEPADVKEYYISRKEKLYRSVIKKGKKKPLFMEVIEKGNICLYEEIVYRYSMYGSTSSTIWYISKGSNIVEQLKFSDIITFKKKTRKEAFGEMLMDNKAVYDKYLAEDKKFTFKQIRNIVHAYNTGQWEEKLD